LRRGKKKKEVDSGCFYWEEHRLALGGERTESLLAANKQALALTSWAEGETMSPQKGETFGGGVTFARSKKKCRDDPDLPRTRITEQWGSAHETQKICTQRKRH